MKKSQQILFPVLISSALILALILIVLPVHAPQAQAAGTSVGREYTLITGSLSDNTIGGDDFLNVIDNRTGNFVTFQLKNQGLEAVGKGRNLFQPVK